MNPNKAKQEKEKEKGNRRTPEREPDATSSVLPPSLLPDSDLSSARLRPPLDRPRRRRGRRPMEAIRKQASKLREQVARQQQVSAPPPPLPKISAILPGRGLAPPARPRDPVAVAGRGCCR